MGPPHARFFDLTSASVLSIPAGTSYFKKSAGRPFSWHDIFMCHKQKNTKQKNTGRESVARRQTGGFSGKVNAVRQVEYTDSEFNMRRQFYEKTREAAKPRRKPAESRTGAKRTARFNTGKTKP